MSMVPLKRRAAVVYGLGQPPPLAEEGVPILRATNIYRGRITTEGLIRARLEDLPLGRAPLLQQGEVLVVRSGAYTGDSALITSEWSGAAPGYDLRVTPLKALDPRFLAYSLLGRRALDHIDLAKSRAAQPHLNAEELGETPILDAPLAEQRAIADFLDAETARIDALITKKRRLIELLDERFWRSVSTSIASLGAKMVPLRRMISRISDGPFGSSLTSAHYEDDGARVVRLGNIGFAEFKDLDKAFISLDHYADLTRHRVSAGDLVIAGLGDSRNHVGRACVAPDLGDAIVKADCYCAGVDRQRAVPEYLALFLSSPSGADQVALAARGTTRSRINLDIAKEIAVPFLPVEEQWRISAAAERQRATMRAATDRLTRQIDLLVEHRQALITAAVTGDLDVSGVAA